VAENPDEWFKKFEICCKANNWNDATKAVKLPTLLEGEALAIWLEFSEDEQASYETAKNLLVSKLTPAEFVSLEEFHKRTLRPGETLTLFVHNLKILLERAMLSMDEDARAQLVVHQFLMGIPQAVSTQIRASGKKLTLEKVVEKARLLMTIRDYNEQPVAMVQMDEVQQLREEVKELTQAVATLSVRREQNKKPKHCFRCNGLGHFQRDCPRQRRCYTCNQPGHIHVQCTLY
jgi:hypothetical protein